MTNEMTDHEFLDAALDQLSPEILASTAACAAAQMHFSERITPNRCIAIADALGAPRGPVLAHMGWINAKADRPNRRAFFDVLVPTLSRHEAVWPKDRETMMALAVCRTLALATTTNLSP